MNIDGKKKVSFLFLFKNGHDMQYALISIGFPRSDDSPFSNWMLSFFMCQFTLSGRYVANTSNRKALS